MSKFSPFEDFWEASKLNKYNMPDYSSRLAFYEPDDNLYKIEYPLPAQKLRLPKSRLMNIARKRSSQRSFGQKPISLRDLGKLLSSAYSVHNTKSRTYPSAGASYAVEIYAVCYNVEGVDKNQILHYDPDTHAAVPVKKSESWEESKDRINVEVEGVPQVLILAVIIGNRLTDKYGERGYRFALLEAGAAMQQLALTIASGRMRGVVAGGMFDDYWTELLGLGTLDAKLAFGYLAGK